MHPLNPTVNDFYPRPPRGGRQSCTLPPNAFSLFLSPPSARRATTGQRFRRSYQRISIPALREEGDLDRLGGCPPPALISIPALREEGDFQSLVLIRDELLFLSPPSARRATDSRLYKKVRQNISIPALREEGDDHANRCLHPCADFYPRPPRGGRLRRQSERRCQADFYPRPPRGGRR